MKPAVIVVGSLNMDFVVRVAALPGAGETVSGSGFEMIPGGKGANQAVVAGKLGAGSVAVRMFGRVGLDLFAHRLKASLAGAGVDVSMVHASRSQPTGMALISVDQAGQNQIVVAAGANGEFNPSETELRRVLKGGRLALFQLESPLDSVLTGLRIARAEGLTTILDPAPARTLPRELLSEVDILTPNESEAFVLLGREPRRIEWNEARVVAEAISELGPRSTILKMGDRGCFYFGAGGTHRIPAFPVAAVDSTAAGDTFNAALAIALAEGSPMPHALRFAGAAAAISVTRAGAQTSAPARSEVDALLTQPC